MPGVFKIKNLQDAEFTLTHPDGVGAVSIDSNNIAKSDVVNAALALKANTADVNTQLSLKANTADLKEIGVGQTWQDVTASRVSGTTYTNSTGKPIFLLIFSTNGNHSGVLNINGISVNYGITTSSYYAMQSVQIVIPNNNTYAVTFADAGIAHKWLELR